MENTQTILVEIEKLEIVVPEFQREYVWSKEQAKQLMVSLFNNYPVGCLLVWTTENPPEIKNQAINKDRGGLWKVLLDGQQRLTTLYLLINGEIPPYYKDDEITHDPRDLCINLQTGDFSYYIMSKMQDDPLWVKVVDCFTQDLDAFTLVEKCTVKNPDEKMQLGKTINTNLNKLRTILKTVPPVQIVPNSANIDAAIDIFDRVNSEGTQLTDAELVLTHITGKWQEARQAMKEKILHYQAIGFFRQKDYQKNLDFFTRCMVVSMTQSALYNKNAKLKYDDFSAADYISHWEKVSKSMDHLIPLLRQDALVSSTNDLSSMNLLVPIIAHLLKNNCQFTHGMKKSFFYWMFLGLIWSRYSGQTDQRLDKDVNLVIHRQNPIAELVKEINIQRGRIEVKAEDIDGCGSNHPLYKMLYIITKHNKAVDWANGGTIYDTIGHYYSIQSHHIFPQSFLYENGFSTEKYADRKKVNEIANRAFITSETNYEISNKAPSDYLPQIQQKYPDALTQQFISTNSSLWDINKYEDFLAKRREMIASGINSFLKELHEGDVKTEQDKDWHEIISEGETQFIEFKSSLRWDYKEKSKSKVLEHAVAKTMSGFLNTEGGTLFIGINDNGETLGLERDYSTLQKKNFDGFRLQLVEVVNNYIGKEFHQYISIKVININSKEICVVEVSPSDAPAFIRHNDKDEFYIRASASTQSMNIREANEYISRKWSD